MNLKRKNQVYTEFRAPATPLHPAVSRKYTMTHSDTTGDLFVVVGTNYAEDKVDPDMQDEVRLTLFPLDNGYMLYGEVLIDGQGIEGPSDVRYMIFKREMPIALGAIRYGDRRFFEADSSRDNTPIFIHFKSSNPTYNQLINFGFIRQYVDFDRH